MTGNFLQRLNDCRAGPDISEHEQVQRRGGLFVKLPRPDAGTNRGRFLPAPA